MGGKAKRWLIRHVPQWAHPYLRSSQIEAIRAARRVLSKLPGTSRVFGPPRRIAPSLGDYIKQLRATGAGDASYLEVQTSAVMRRSPPVALRGGTHPEFQREMTRVSPPTGVGVIPEGRVATATGAVIGPDDTLVRDVSDFVSEHVDANPILVALRLPRIERAAETIAVLTTYRSNIYYHWLFDALPRLWLVRQCGIAFDRVVAPCQAAFQRETLGLLSIHPEEIIGEPDRQIQAARLVVPSMPAVVGNPTDWACRFLRESFLRHVESDAPAGRKVFVSRAKAGHARIDNEDAVFAMLERYGFERHILEDWPFLEQVRIFSEASIVVGSHGSGLSNLVFCRPGTRVIELFNPHYMNVVFWALSNQVGLRYHYLAGRGADDVSTDRGGRGHENITVDVDALERAVGEFAAADAAESGTRPLDRAG